jgi:hypothetical protein
MAIDHFPLFRKEMRTLEGKNNELHQNQENFPFDLTAVGASLKAKREKQNLEHRTIAESLFIKKSTIDAIENGKWQDLPHSLYVKGYVRSYGQYLGISAQIESLLKNSAIVESLPCDGYDHTGPAEYFRDVHVRPPSKSLYEQTVELCSKAAFRKTIVACSTLVGFVFGIILFSTIQVSSLSLKDVFAACHLAISDIRKVFLS